MGAELILKSVALLMPYAIQGGIDLVSSIQRMQAGESVDDLITEFKAKRDDLEPLTFKEG